MLTDKADKKEPIKNKAKTFHLLRGMKDILPEEQHYWRFVYDKIDKIAAGYGFKRIDPPILEEKSLFVRSVGEETDIVQKEMFSFADQSGDQVALRPEATASLVRAYIEHGMINLSQPVKLYTSGPFFRYERPQAGRARQFHQFNFEVIGSLEPIIDTQLILFAKTLYEKEFGLAVTIEINNIGCPECRPRYKEKLAEYYRARRKDLCEDCKKRLIKNPLRILDCKEKLCQELSVEAPQAIDNLCEACHQHFVLVLENLDEAEVAYNLNPKIVRGLDYYTKTTFEIWLAGEDLGSQSALAGGGRYDNLIEEMGGRPTSAIGFALGVERLIGLLKEKGIEVPAEPVPEVFLAQLGEPARRKALRLYEALREGGVRVAENLAKDGLKPQLEISAKLKAKYTLIIGQKEITDDTILFRDMENGIQEVIDYNKAVPEIKKRLARSLLNNHSS